MSKNARLIVVGGLIALFGLSQLKGSSWGPAGDPGGSYSNDGSYVGPNQAEYERTHDGSNVG